MTHKAKFLPLFEQIYKSNTAAIELSFMLLDVMHIWDDLVDRDKPVVEDDINRAFFMSLQMIPTHPLWNVGLSTMLTSVYLRWHTATHIERDKAATDNDLAKAWMLRAGVFDLFELLCQQLFGLAWAEDCGPAIRAYYGEPLKAFIKEIRQCQNQPQA